MRLTAIVLAAGKGTRLNSKVPKPLVNIGSKPMLAHCLDVLKRHNSVYDIIVAVNRANAGEIARLIRRLGVAKISRVVMGGRRRQDSVANALARLDAATEWVLIHDAARPFIDTRIISSVINAARKTGAAVAAVPVKATVKKVTGRFTVKETLDRESLWEIQTPQVFRKKVILEAYERYSDTDVTDDAALVEKTGSKVRVVRGSYANIKITTPEDLVIAEAISEAKCHTA